MSDSEVDVKIDIFGSCVTRDVFSYIQKTGLRCGEYIARQSIVSAFAPKLPFTEEDLAELDSTFQKRMVKNDFEKTAFDKLEDSKGDYLIVDFIDERFHIVQIGRTYITYSAELMLSKYLEGKNYKIIDKRKWINKNVVLDLKKQIAMFAEKIEDIYGKGRVIIHRAKLKDNYLDQNGNKQKFLKPFIEDNKKTNELLEYMYDELEKRLVEPYVIDVADSYLADETNKWGLSTMHYQEEYYVEVLRRVKDIVMNYQINLDKKEKE